MSSQIQHFSDLRGVLEVLHLEKRYSDAVLIVEDQEFPILRAVLAAQSPFFDRLLFDNQFDEGQSVNCIKIDAYLEAFSLILKYFYTGEMDLEDKDIEDIYDILELSHRYDLCKLENDLIDRMAALTDITNFHWSIRAANLFKSKKLQLKCVDILNDNETEIFEGEDCLKFSEGEVIELLSCEDLIWTTIEKFEALSKWMSANSGYNKDKLLKLVDLDRLSMAQINQYVAPTNLFDEIHLFTLLSLRDADVEEEVKIYHNYLLPEKDAKIVMGNCPHNMRSTSEFVFAEIIDGKKTIIVDLGQLRGINCFKFNLGDRSRKHDYSLKFSASDDFQNSSDWTNHRTFEHCRGKQTIWFPTSRVRFIYIEGVARCNDFQAAKLQHLPDMRGHFIAPKENIFTPQNAVITDGLGKAISQNAITFGETDTAYTESPHWIYFRLNQPYFLSKCRFRLGEGTSQLFVLHAFDSKWEGKTTTKTDSWHTVDLEAKVYSEFRFYNQSPTPLRIVHFEASA